jgi:hypothetical protein
MNNEISPSAIKRSHTFKEALNCLKRDSPYLLVEIIGKEANKPLERLQAWVEI